MTPDPEEPFTPAAMASRPGRPLSQKIAYAAIAVLVSVAAALAIVIAFTPSLRNTASPAAQGGIPGGSAFAVPGEVKPGTYETTSSDLEDCYWERARNGDIVDNKFVTASKVKIRVTIRATDDTFITRNCGNWIKVN